MSQFTYYYYYYIIIVIITIVITITTTATANNLMKLCGRMGVSPAYYSRGPEFEL
jgi:hypothetical protein